jgi:sulfur-oxidizing protein SoxY
MASDPGRRAPTDRARRALLRLLGAAGALVPLLSVPGVARALERNRAGFEAKVLEASLAAIDATTAEETGDILIKAPDIAENSAIVHVEVQSRIPGTESVFVLAEKNPQPLVAQFDLTPSLEPFIAVRIKMNESAHVRVVVRAGGRMFFARKEVKVTLGGCIG